MIIVLGTGRCGTSTIARLLHTKLNIPMGERFRPGDDSNLNGFYEDLDFRDLNHHVLNGNCSGFEKELHCLVTKRQERWGDDQWGVKDPRICNLWRWYKRYDAQYIFCARRSQMVVRSMMANYDWSEKDSNRLVAFRLQGIERLLEGKDALRIDFSTKRDESELTNLLKRILT